MMEGVFMAEAPLSILQFESHFLPYFSYGTLLSSVVAKKEKQEIYSSRPRRISDKSY